MPRRCVVGGCNNIPGGDISVHKFPKESKLRRIWINFVNITRSDFVCTENSVICSAHFEEDCFEASFLLKQQFGLGSRGRALTEGKYPTITRKDETGPLQSSKKRRLSSERRQRKQVR